MKWVTTSWTYSIAWKYFDCKRVRKKTQTKQVSSLHSFSCFSCYFFFLFLFSLFFTILRNQFIYGRIRPFISPRIPRATGGLSIVVRATGAGYNGISILMPILIKFILWNSLQCIERSILLWAKTSSTIHAHCNHGYMANNHIINCNKDKLSIWA